MISVAEALAHVTSGVRLLSAEQVGVADALGRVLAEDVASRVAYPPATASAMDGYAVRAADVAEAPATLRRIGESLMRAGDVEAATRALLARPQAAARRA